MDKQRRRGKNTKIYITILTVKRFILVWTSYVIQETKFRKEHYKSTTRKKTTSVILLTSANTKYLVLHTIYREDIQCSTLPDPTRTSTKKKSTEKQ